MKRQVGATTVLAALLMLVGAVLLDTQWPGGVGQGVSLSNPLYLLAEVGFYLLLLMALDRGLNATGYLLGALGALGLRLGVGFAAAGLARLREGGPYDAQLFPAVFSLTHVVIAAGAAAAALILLRDLLPQRPTPVRPARPARRPAQPTEWAAAPGEASKLAFEVAAGLPPAREKPDTDSPSEIILLEAEARPPEEPRPEPSFEGEIELPLSVLLRDAAQQAGPAEGRETATVPLPLGVIGPQLGEGRIVVTVGQLVEWAPAGAVNVTERDPDAEISLPVEAVVEALPPGALALGPPSPPPWCRDLSEVEEVLFCAG